MNCPKCKTIELENTTFQETDVDFCSQCLGTWFEIDELAQAKDTKDKNLRWLDIDLWQDEKKFNISKDEKACPLCEVPLYVIEYGKSKVKVDLCNLCHSIWLDRGEFGNIINYLKKESTEQILKHYFKNVLEETAEVFWGPEDFPSEVKDFLTIINMLNYKFSVKHPVINQLIAVLPK